MKLFTLLILALQPFYFIGAKEGGKTLLHPFHVSTTQIEYIEKEKSLQVMVYIFTDDFENTLKEEFKTPIDLINPKGKQLVEGFVAEYLVKNLKLVVDAKQLKLKVIGYEIEKEFALSYIEIENLPRPKKIEVTNTLLLKNFTDQKNIVKVDISNIKKSRQLDISSHRHVFEF